MTKPDKHGRVVSALPTAERAGKDRKFMCLMAFAWGTGPTIKQAFIRALHEYRPDGYGRKARVGELVEAVFLDAPKNAYVDGMGSVNWNIKEAEAQGGPAKRLHDGAYPMLVKAIPFTRAKLD